MPLGVRRATVSGAVPVSSSRAAPAAASAAQGDVQVVGEPAGQADVPPPPEIPDGTGSVGLSEVLGKPDAHEPGTAHGDIGVAGEVAVDLQGKEHGGQHHGHTTCTGSVSIGRIHKGGQEVGDEHLFAVSTHQEPDALGDVLLIQGVGGLQLGQQVTGALDGSRHQLREKGDKQSVVPQVSLGPDGAPIDVKGVGHGLEHIEGDAHGQQQMEAGKAALHPEQLQQGEHAPQGKVHVFEEEQDAQAHHRIQNHRTALLLSGLRPLDAQSACVGHQGGEKDEAEQPGAVTGVEEIGGGQEHHPPLLPGGKPVEGQHRREKEEKTGGHKAHFFSPLTTVRKQVRAGRSSRSRISS